jgi:hypothetical protein
MYAAAASCPLQLFLIGDIVSPWSPALGVASCPLRLFSIGDIVSPWSRALGAASCPLRRRLVVCHPVR